MDEISAFGESLQERRIESVESASLLGKVLEGIDIAVLGFDMDQRIRLSNRRGETLLGREFAELEGAHASELSMADWLQGESPRLVDVEIGLNNERWELRRGSYRESGRPHVLLILSDVTPALREQERQAWQRLVRVLRHEVNNSLAPIQSIANTLSQLVDSENAQTDWQADLREGLSIIANRSRSLGGFLNSYRSISELPKPTLNRVDVSRLVERVVALETRVVVDVRPGPELAIGADSAQLEQLLINVVRNAAEAALETQGTVAMSWCVRDGRSAWFELCVDDTGLGIANSQNLFVPFYTTKPEGSGIGLALSRLIAEAHGGTLSLENRTDHTGCRARLRLPFHPWDDESQQ